MTIAASRSLSPNLISSTLIVSFSLMIGTASHSNRAVQRVPHVQVAGPAVEVLVGQQELGGVPAVPAEAFVVGADQVRLADGGGGLELAEVVGPPRQAELADPRADRPRADQGDLPAGGHDRADLLGQVVDPGRVERPVGAGQDARPDLDDPGPRRQDDSSRTRSRTIAMRGSSTLGGPSRREPPASRFAVNGSSRPSDGRSDATCLSHVRSCSRDVTIAAGRTSVES